MAKKQAKGWKLLKIINDKTNTFLQ
jgi:hypothetical protein